MTWSNSPLLFGALLIAAPIILHFLMKQKPKRVEFPALRFVRARTESTKRRMRLQHVVLLALRCLLIVVAAMALARPSVASAAASRWSIAALLMGLGAALGVMSVAAQREQQGGARAWLPLGLMIAAALLGLSGLTAAGLAYSGSEVLAGDQEAPIAAALVFDSSPRMELMQANKTSLERAQGLATQLLRELPADSQIAVLDSRREGAYWSPDRGAARTAVDRLESTGAPAPLAQTIVDAVQQVEGSEFTRREVYVFTDLTRAAWEDAGDRVLRALDEAPQVTLYIMDVGAEKPVNLALSDLDLSAVTLPVNGELKIGVSLTARGVGGVYQVRLELEESDPTLPLIEDGVTKLPPLNLRGRAAAEVSDSQSASLELTAVLDEPGIHHGRVVIESASAGDSLEIDNERHFTVEVREAWPVLVATGPEASADFLVEALAPADYEDFQCRVIEQSDLATADLSQFDAVALLDPGPLEDALWQRLAAYVRSGGAVWIQLGRNARSDTSFNGEAAQQVLGAPLTRQWRTKDRNLFMTTRDRSHPALAYFRDETVSAPWPSLPVFKHWVLGPLPPSARILMGFSANTHPAVYEWPVGEGRVAVSTTPLSDVTYSKNAWNELAFGDNNWPPFILCNELLLEMVRGQRGRLNFVAGETVELGNDDRVMPRRYQLFLPSEPPQDVTSQESVLRMPYTATPGQYRLKGNRGGLVVRGFSCNLPASMTRLERASQDEIESALGPGRVQFVRHFDQLQRVQDRQRVGREFFSILMLMLVGLMVVEFLVANRFYRRSNAQTLAGRRAAQIAATRGDRGDASSSDSKAAQTQQGGAV